MPLLPHFPTVPDLSKLGQALEAAYAAGARDGAVIASLALVVLYLLAKEYRRHEP